MSRRLDTPGVAPVRYTHSTLVKSGRRAVHLSELSYGELQELAKTSVADTARTDLELLITVGRLWGEEAVGQFRFADACEDHEPSTLMGLLQGFRS